MCTHICKGTSLIFLLCLPPPPTQAQGSPIGSSAAPSRDSSSNSPAWCPLVPLQPWGDLLCCAGASASFLHTVSWNSLWGAAMNIAKNSAEQGRASCFSVPRLANLNHICCVAEGNIALFAVGYWSTSKSRL